mgnify:FL=1
MFLYIHLQYNKANNYENRIKSISSYFLEWEAVQVRSMGFDESRREIEDKSKFFFYWGWYFWIIELMEKKKRDQMLPKRFNSGDIEKWQELANKETGGNLTLLIELTMNKAVERAKKPS